MIICFTVSYSQSKISYTLNYTPNSEKVVIELEFDSISTYVAKLVIPRSGPGTYDLTNYLAFVSNVKGYTVSEKVINGVAGDGSFFTFENNDELLIKVSYEVDIKKMELDLLGGFSSSKIRENYLGILGYSVFGFIEGYENQAIILNIKTNNDWPIFSTLSPSIDRKKGTETYETENFALLADGQYLLGSSVKVFQVVESKIPLFVATYSETPISPKEIGRRALLALNGLADYFGYVPMPYYTLCYEFLNPISTIHNYGFSMEHLNSMTASFSVSSAILEYNENARIGGIVHHMGHSWIPLRSYGIGYRPFEWQTAPIIETIWLNEGFTWYVSFYNVLGYKRILNFFKKTINEAPDYIQKKSLKELSILGSTQYSMDFRIGKNLYSRGALLAYDLDILIQKETGGEKSFKDAILGLLKWTENNKRAFEYNEIESIMSESTGVDLSDVWNNWQKSQK
ncbi:hypothetical protein QWY81_05410 [Polaribacter undariae]|uniref:Peptidase M61 N-terminal domain-containing protein n=1 Tax=Polaribacter sejongensis TaxID=985043 RepID=A0AAJ1VG45_9FLAO|nr:hypothetical protein [Polaribacter undariae]MDN3618894.1 hypothetical protein [Polaribacter undariae]UWD32984.1 hypothetical protein NQP51_04700 [Polaribacter undariae]